MHGDLSQIKTAIINRITVLTAILLTPAYILSLCRTYGTGWLNIYIYHTILYVSTIFVVIFRHKLSFSFKVISISSIYIIVAIAGLISFSFGSSYYFVIITFAILSILVKRRITLILTTGIAVLFALIAYGFLSGFLTPKIELNKLTAIPYHWMTNFVSLFSLIIIFVYGFGDFYQELIHSLQQNDISKKELIEKQNYLEATEFKYRILFEKANDAITLLKDGVFFDCNEKACEFFQYTRDDIIGKRVSDVSPEYQSDGQKSEDKGRELVRLTMEGSPQRFEWQHIRANGEVFDLSISLSKIELHNEVYVQGILRDITEKKKQLAELEMHRHHLEKLVRIKTKDLEAALEEWRTISEELSDKQKIIQQQNDELKVALNDLKEAQTQLIQAEKMASLGTLTAGVAHEINNPLNYIMGAYIGLENYFEENESNDKETTEFLLESIKNGLDRASDIVQGLNQFSRHNETLSEDCDLHSIINNCLVMMYNKTRNKVDVNKRYSPESVIIKGNVGQLHQVFTNLLVNAIQAIKEKGEITIETKVNKKYISILICDNGCGIEEKNIQQITDPFFTTKPAGEGTGLGLSITYSIIKKHKGEIEFTSEIAKGTNVKIKLPKK